MGAKWASLYSVFGTQEMHSTIWLVTDDIMYKFLYDVACIPSADSSHAHIHDFLGTYGP